MNSNWPIVHFIVRWILGVLFLMAGYWKVFVLTPAEHASQYFVNGFADYWIPEWLLYVLGVSIPAAIYCALRTFKTANMPVSSTAMADSPAL